MDEPNPNGKDKTVYRAPKSKETRQGYLRILNSVIQDSRLSYRARGVLAYVLSMPDNWTHSAEKISANGIEGRDAIQSALRELRQFGYHSFDRRGADGKFNTVLRFRERPEPEKPSLVETPTRAGISGAGKTEAGKTEAGFSGSLETTITNNDEETKLRETKMGCGAVVEADLEEALDFVDDSKPSVSTAMDESTPLAATPVPTARDREPVHAYPDDDWA